MEITDKVKEQVRFNIQEVYKFLTENAIENEGIWVDYGTKNETGKFSEHLYITTSKVETGNNWGYSTRYKNILDDLDVYEQIAILEQWEDIKSRFRNEVNKITAKEDALYKAVFDFHV